jgi:hypothetical protein
MTLRYPQGSGQAGIWVAGQETVSRHAITERVIGQPPNGTERGAGVAQGVPRWQLRVAVCITAHSFWRVSALERLEYPVCRAGEAPLVPGPAHDPAGRTVILHG